jgi:hypothetical protein
MYRISKAVNTSIEEKTAIGIGKLLSNFHLDLEKVGYYLAKATPYLVYRRALEVLESAQFQQDIEEQKRIEYGKYDKLY